MQGPEDLVVGYTHMVSGPQWMERYLGHQKRIDELHSYLFQRYYADAESQGLIPVGEPSLTTEYDEQRRSVILRLDGWGHRAGA